MNLSLLTNKKLQEFFIEKKDALMPVAELLYAHEHPLAESFVKEINEMAMIAIGLIQIKEDTAKEKAFVSSLMDNVVNMNGHMLKIKEVDSAKVVLINLRDILHKADAVMEELAPEAALSYKLTHR